MAETPKPTFWDRILISAFNGLLLIPIEILLIVSLVMTGIIKGKIKNLSDYQSDSMQSALSKVNGMYTLLWFLVFFPVFFFIPIINFIPAIVISIPYLYGFALLIFAIINIIIAVNLFSAAALIANSQDYKDGTTNAKSAFAQAIIVGIIVIVGSLFLLMYAGYGIYKYHAYGGFIGDFVIGSQVGGTALQIAGTVTAQPELVVAGMGLQQVGKAVGTEEQQARATQATGQVQQVAEALQQFQGQPTTGQPAGAQQQLVQQLLQAMQKGAPAEQQAVQAAEQQAAKGVLQSFETSLAQSLPQIESGLVEAAELIPK